MRREFAEPALDPMEPPRRGAAEPHVLADQRGPNAGQAVTAATAGTLGQVTSYRDPRQIQAGLKFYF